MAAATLSPLSALTFATLVVGWSGPKVQQYWCSFGDSLPRVAAQSCAQVWNLSEATLNACPLLTVMARGAPLVFWTV